jgi:tRNA-specific adenosine deaminase 2
MSKYDPSFMREALVVAQEAYDHLEVPVGCVFVLNNETIIARGRNKPNESSNVRRNDECLVFYIFIDGNYRLHGMQK